MKYEAKQIENSKNRKVLLATIDIEGKHIKRSSFNAYGTIDSPALKTALEVLADEMGFTLVPKKAEESHE